MNKHFLSYIPGMRLLPLTLLLFLSACAGTNPNPLFLHQVPMGTVLSLEQPLPVKANSVRVYLQNGKAYPYLSDMMHNGGADSNKPYCTLELQHKSDNALTLSPRKYVIAGVTWDSTYQYFDTSMYRTRWTLSGGGIPRALYFSCYRLGSTAHGTPIRLEEVDAVVGAYFRLLPAESNTK